MQKNHLRCYSVQFKYYTTSIVAFSSSCYFNFASEKLKILLLLPILLVGCASQAIKPTQNESIPNGTWTGMFEYSGVKADRSKHSGIIFIVVAACQNEVRFWSNGGDGTYRSPEVKFHLNSYLGSHTISFKQEAGTLQPDWVETQTLLLVETSATRANFQWTRAVSNRDLEEGKPNRTFFEHGTGKLEHTSIVCQKGEISSVAAKAISVMESKLPSQ